MRDEKSMFQEAEILRKNKKPTEALEIYSYCSLSAQNPETIIGSYIGMAKCYYNLLLLEDVKRITDAILVKGSLDQANVGEILNLKAMAYIKGGSYKEAIKICGEMLHIEDRKILCKTHSLLGVIYGDLYFVTLGNQKEKWLEKSHQEHIKSYELAVTQPEKIARSHNMAWINYLKKDYAKAEEYIEEVIKLIEVETLDEAITLNLLGLIRIGQERYQEADVCLKKALAILYEIGSTGTEWVAQNHHYRAVMLFKQKEYIKAEKHFELALELSKEKGLIRDAAQLYLELAQVYEGIDKVKTKKYYVQYKKLEEKLFKEGDYFEAEGILSCITA